MPLNQSEKKGVNVLTGKIDPDYQGDFGLLDPPQHLLVLSITALEAEILSDSQSLVVSNTDDSTL